MSRCSLSSDDEEAPRFLTSHISETICARVSPVVVVVLAVAPRLPPGFRCCAVVVVLRPRQPLDLLLLSRLLRVLELLLVLLRLELEEVDVVGVEAVPVRLEIE